MVKWLEVMKVAKALKVAASVVQVAKDVTEVVVSEFLNADARVVHEEYQTIFGETGKITKELGDYVLIRINGAPISHKAAVPFYGCSKCRYNRKGCINYKCHPEKFEAHFAKFPEMYVAGTKGLLNKEFIKMSNKDLIGGGRCVFTRFPRSQTWLCAHCRNKTNKPTYKQHTRRQHINT